MKLIITQTDNYLLVVDDSEIKSGDYRCNVERGYIRLVDDDPSYYNKRKDVFKKVILHLPINGSDYLEGVPLLPEIGNDAEESASGWIEENSYKWSNNNDEAGDNYGSFRAGYLKSRETYKYTEQMAKAIWNAGQEYWKTSGASITFEELTEKLLQQPKYPIAFEFEMVCGNLGCMKMSLNGESSVCCGDYMKPETTTLPGGQTVWVGKYIY